MDTPQGDLFKDAPEARECAECGRKFVPEEDYHEFCNRCWKRKQRRRKRPRESNAEWMERFYGRTTT